MVKGTKLSEFEKGEVQLWKNSENLREKFRRLYLGRSKAVICNYLTSPIKKKTDWQAIKIITTIQEKNCSGSKKENFAHMKNIEIPSGCSLQY